VAETSKLSALQPREAVRAMAPYHPPSGGREGKLRLDFNENTVGCSPKVIELLREKLTAERLSLYPEYADALRPASSRSPTALTKPFNSSSTRFSTTATTSSH